ncbi:MAG: hypothetical protein IPG53_17675 [Ignavibacteriales bacterium]|nr:hypothetical protein [Ignavibacteriales bacterium]
MGRNEDALKFFSKAFILGDKQISLYTWHLFIDTAKFLETTGKNEESQWHLDYVFHSAINDEGNKPQEMPNSSILPATNLRPTQPSRTKN